MGRHFTLENSITRFLISFSIKLLLLVMLALWLFGIVIPLMINKSGLIASIYLPLKNIYSFTCHQSTEKVFSANGFDFLVCARCFGIYTGAFLTLLPAIFLSFKKNLNLKLLAAASVIMLIDVVSTSLGIYSYSKESAFITGLLLGSTVFLYILNVIENYFGQKK